MNGIGTFTTSMGRLRIAGAGSLGGTGAALGLAIAVRLPQVLYLTPLGAAAGATAGFNIRPARDLEGGSSAPRTAP